MRRIAIDMQNTLFADAIAEALRRFDSDLDPILSESPDQTLSLCETISAHVLIMEVTAYTAWCLEERMKLRDALKETARLYWWWTRTPKGNWRTWCAKPKKTDW